MDRKVLAVVAGVVTALLLTGFIGWAGDYIFPPSPLVDNNPELIKTMGAPILGTLTKLIGWGVGVFAGAMIAMRMAEADVWPAVAVGAVMGAFEIVLLFLAPHQVVYVALTFAVIGASAFGAAWLSTHGQSAEQV